MQPHPSGTSPSPLPTRPPTERPAPQLRKTYPLKCLHDLRLHRGTAPGGGGSGSFSEQQHPGVPASQLLRSGSGHDGDGGGGGGGGSRPLPSVEVRLAHHHSAPDHRGIYFFPDLQQALLFMSLAVQLLRCGRSGGGVAAGRAAAARAQRAPERAGKRGAESPLNRPPPLAGGRTDCCPP